MLPLNFFPHYEILQKKLKNITRSLPDCKTTLPDTLPGENIIYLIEILHELIVFYRFSYIFGQFFKPKPEISLSDESAPTFFLVFCRVQKKFFPRF